MELHLSRRRSTTAVALVVAIVFAVGAVVVVAVARPGPGSTPLSALEYGECLADLGPGGGADQALEPWPEIPSPIASAVRDAYARAQGQLANMVSATTQTDSEIKAAVAKYEAKINNDPRVIADCRAFIAWKYGFLKLPIPSGY